MGLKARPARASSSSNPKTRATRASAAGFLASIPDGRRRECQTLATMMAELTGAPPVMWGTSIVGFGQYHYVYASGREGDWPRTGFSPRKQALTVYCMAGFDGADALLRKLGPHKTGASCLYIRKLDDVDLDVLRAIVARSLDEMARRYPL